MKIFKYKLQIGTTVLSIPSHYQILDIQLQNNELTLWAMVDPLKSKIEITLVTIGTGHEFELGNLTYIDTVQQDGFVWHIFKE